MMSGEGKVVCVTGTNGFIASWIVKFLLQCGYTVRATVPHPSQCFFFLQIPSLNEKIEMVFSPSMVFLVYKQVILKRLITWLNLMVQRRGCNSLRHIFWKKVPLTLPLRVVMVSFILLHLFFLS